MVSDSERRDLFSAAETALGAQPARTLMELLPPVGWSDVARQSDLTHMGALLRSEMADLRVELKTEMADLRVELKTEMSDLRGDVRGQLPRLIAANIASMIGVATLVLAAARLA
ncbi:MAG TPA: hypothetical protein VGI06_16215 [Acidimicrobiales bacterium]|jgi:hypothetical protein